MTMKTVESEADTLDEAKSRLRSQIPDGHEILSEKILADGSEEIAVETAPSIEEALRKAQSHMPEGAQILRKDETQAPAEHSVAVEAFTEEQARALAAGGVPGGRTIGGCPVGTAIVGIRMVQRGRRGFLGLGRTRNRYACRILCYAKAQIRFRRTPKVIAEIAERPAFFRFLATAAADATGAYESDRNEAFGWFDQQSFPCPPINTLECAKYATDMSLMADDESIWKEAWAGFHRALASNLHLRRDPQIADIVWRLGRAHTGLGNDQLASLYLRVAEVLAEDAGKCELRERVLLDQAVLAAMKDYPAEYKTAIDRVFAVFFPGGRPSQNASKAAFTVFDEGRKNQQWRKDGQPVPLCLRHAHGFYQVSLDMNRKLGSKEAVGFSLINLGDLAKKLGHHDKAPTYWQEAFQVFRDLGDEKNTREVENRLRSR